MASRKQGWLGLAGGRRTDHRSRVWSRSPLTTLTWTRRAASDHDRDWAAGGGGASGGKGSKGSIMNPSSRLCLSQASPSAPTLTPCLPRSGPIPPPTPPCPTPPPCPPRVCPTPRLARSATCRRMCFAKCADSWFRRQAPLQSQSRYPCNPHHRAASSRLRPGISSTEHRAHAR